MKSNPILLLLFLSLSNPVCAQEIGYTELYDMLANAKTEEFKRHLSECGYEIISKEAIDNSASRMYIYACNYNKETAFADAWVHWEIFSNKNKTALTIQFTDTLAFMKLKEQIKDQFHYKGRKLVDLDREKEIPADVFNLFIKENLPVDDIALSTSITAHTYSAYNKWHLTNAWYITLQARHYKGYEVVLEPLDED